VSRRRLTVLYAAVVLKINAAMIVAVQAQYNHRRPA